MARPSAEYLSKIDQVKEIILVDLNLAGVKAFAKELGPKAKPKTANVKNKEELVNVITGANLVMNFIGPYFQFGTKTLETAIELGIDYIDICDDYDVTEEALKLSEKAKEKGVTAIIGMGASPGVTNVLARLGSDALDEVEEINTYWLVGDAEPGGLGALIHLFHCIEDPIPTFKNGAFKQIRPYQLETARKVDFGDPVGTATLFHVGHPEPITLPRFIPNVQTVTNFGAILPESQNLLFKTLVDFGLASEEPIPFKGEQVKPLDFLLSLIGHKQEKIMQKSSRVETRTRSVGASRVEVIGKKDGKESSITFTRSGYDTMANSTSIPTAIVAADLLMGDMNEKGVLPPEILDPKKILLDLKEVGFFNEAYSYEVIEKSNGIETKTTLFDSQFFNEEH